MESLQSHCINTMSHWSSGLPICFPSQGTRVQSPGGYLCETGIFLLALSRYNTGLAGVVQSSSRASAVGAGIWDTGLAGVVQSKSNHMRIQ